MQFWLVGFGLSLAILASENFRHFRGKKPQIEIDSERTELTSTLLTYIKEYGHILKYQKANEHVKLVLVPYCLYTVKNRAQVLKRKNVKIICFNKINQM